MRGMRIIFCTVIALLSGACSTASGPIKGYDESANIDKTSLSRVYLPPEIDVQEVNGKEKETPFISEGFNEIHLAPGQHNVTIRYKRYWGDSVSGNMVTSNPVTLNFQTTAKSEYMLKFKQARDTWEAQAIASKFTPWLEDAKGGGKVAVKINKGNAVPVVAGAGMGMSAEEIVARQKPLEKLKFWWKLADKEDRKAFRRWIEEN